MEKKGANILMRLPLRKKFFPCLMFAVLLAVAAPRDVVAYAAGDAIAGNNSVARLIADRAAVAPGETFWIGLEITMQDGWDTYWANPGDSGLPTEIALTLPEGFTHGGIHWPVPERFQYSGIWNYGYFEHVILPIPVTAPKALVTDSQVTMTAKATWLVCKDICVPESGTLTLSLPVQNAPSQAQADAPLTKTVAVLPTPSGAKASYRVAEEEVELTVAVPANGVAAAEFFPLTDGILHNGPPLASEIGADSVRLRHKKAAPFAATPLEGLLVLADPQNNRKGLMITAVPEVSPPAADASTDITLPLALGLALLGGLLLNIMPCVLPVLSLKILALVEKSRVTRRDSILHALSYTAGVLGSFALLAGSLIALQRGGAAIGWGFQLQSPGFVTLLTAVMFLVGLNLSGAFHISGALGGLGHRLAGKDGLAGSFFTGALATLVATPCTAPFMAPAIGFALTRAPAEAFLIFEALGLGLALPFLLVGFWPWLRRHLPKPGAWMVTFKQFLAFPMYATAAWLLWVLSVESGTRALAHAMGFLLAVAFLVWVWGQGRSRWRDIAIVLALLLGGWFFLHASRDNYAIEAAGMTQPFSMATLEKLREENTPVFVDVTAAWCLTCRVNEMTTLHAERVQQHFKERGIVTLVADWTARDAAITQYLASFGRQGVPMYVYYPPGGEPKLLPQLLTVSIVTTATQ